MKKVFFISLIFLCNIFLLAQENRDDKKKLPLGIGLRAGDPSGITIKKYNEASSLELCIGALPFNNGASVFLHYLIHNPITELGETNNIEGLHWYYGVGGQIKSISGNGNFGLDAVLGSEFRIPDHPIAIFLDFIMYLEIIDSPFDVGIDGGIGGRYIF